MWSGRLGAETSPLVERYTSSIDVDRRLAPDDVAGSRAHAAMLRDVGLIGAADHAAIDAALGQIDTELRSGAFRFDAADEDIHSAVERRLFEIAGPVAGVLHTGRSRNDQVATDMRLAAKRACADIVGALLALQTSLMRRAGEEADTVMPSYTHLQRAQPVTLGHHLLAYVAMAERDAGRLLDARTRCDVLPLGSGAVAGSTLPLDRGAVATALGFAASSRNSMDAVSDRDFAVEIAAACALVMVHASRLAEEIVLWTSAEFGFAVLPDTHATGSSLMPNKKNADVAELARGRAGRVVGDTVALLTMLKGLPLAYNRDLQEDKSALFDAVDTALATITALTEVIDVLEFDRGAMRRAASDPDVLATDAAEYLVTRGVAFREAHAVVGRLVRRVHEQRRTLADLSVDEWRDASPAFDESVLQLFDLDAAISRRRTPGGPNRESIDAQLAAARRGIEQARARLDSSG